MDILSDGGTDCPAPSDQRGRRVNHLGRVMPPGCPRAPPARSAMVTTAGEAECVLEVAQRKEQTNVGCVVVVEDGKPVGILSIDDVMELLVEEAQGIGKPLREAAPNLAGSG